MRKKTSSNFANEAKLQDDCAMIFTLSLITGRWKPAIFWNLVKGRMRYSELKRAIPAASERMLIAQLREMEEDKVVKRIIYKQVPPRVEYELTEMGKSLEEVLLPLNEWGKKYQNKRRTARLIK